MNSDENCNAIKTRDNLQFKRLSFGLGFSQKACPTRAGFFMIDLLYLFCKRNKTASQTVEHLLLTF